jgi:formylmethanofuran dehydrogenase subunit E
MIGPEGDPLDPPDDESHCEGCGMPVYGEGRYTLDDVYLCGPCYEAAPPKEGK